MELAAVAVAALVAATTVGMNTVLAVAAAVPVDAVPWLVALAAAEEVEALGSSPLILP